MIDGKYSTRRFLGVLSASVMAVALSVTAQASTQDDIQSCREAMAGRTDINIEEYRLSFQSKKGNRNTTLKMEAIPNGDGDKFLVTCLLTKGEVTDIQLEAK